MSATIPVISGVSMPKPTRNRDYKYPFKDLEVGGMFFLEGLEENKFSPYASLWGRKLKRKFRTCLLYMRKSKGMWVQCDAETKGATLGVGVWRTE